MWQISAVHSTDACDLYGCIGWAIIEWISYILPVFRKWFTEQNHWPKEHMTKYQQVAISMPQKVVHLSLWEDTVNYSCILDIWSKTKQTCTAITTRWKTSVGIWLSHRRASRKTPFAAASRRWALSVSLYEVKKAVCENTDITQRWH